MRVDLATDHGTTSSAIGPVPTDPINMRKPQTPTPATEGRFGEEHRTALQYVAGPALTSGLRVATLALVYLVPAGVLTVRWLSPGALTVSLPGHVVPGGPMRYPTRREGP